MHSILCSGTKQFKIEVAQVGRAAWTTVVVGQSLEDPTKYANCNGMPPIERFAASPVVVDVRYVRFTAVDYYGYLAALQYINWETTTS